MQEQLTGLNPIQHVRAGRCFAQGGFKKFRSMTGFEFRETMPLNCGTRLSAANSMVGLLRVRRSYPRSARVANAPKLFYLPGEL